MAFMSAEERDELVDLVAQAVIDRIEERDRINGLADLVVARVLSLQHQEHALGATEVARTQGSQVRDGQARDGQDREGQAPGAKASPRSSRSTKQGGR